MQVIANEAHNHKTVVIQAREKDGTIETREVEPYSTRIKGGNTLFYGYCLKKAGMRSWYVVNIIRAEPTGNSFNPRFPVEF
jgi:predicted DNA-binding transcriptional regulator YafY